MDSDIVSMKKMIGDTDISSIGDGTLSGAIDTISKNSGGSGNSSKVFDTFADMEAWLKDASNKGILEVGNNLYIKESDITDYWVSGVLDSADSNTGYYYEIEELGAEKLDMSEYEDAIDNLNTSVEEIRNMASVVTVTDELGVWTVVNTLENGYDFNISASSIVYAQNKFVMIVADSTSDDTIYPVYISTDGVNWVRYETDIDTSGTLLYGDDKFVLVGYHGIWYSLNGIDWIESYQSTTFMQVAVYANDAFWASSEGYNGSSTTMTSTDGINWIKLSGNCGIPALCLADLVYGNGKFIAVGGDMTPEELIPIVQYSEDMCNWVTATIDSTDETCRLESISYGNGVFVAVGDCEINNKKYPYIIYSTNGVEWSRVNVDIMRSGSLNKISYINGKFITSGYTGYNESGNGNMYGNAGVVYYSEDGITWTLCQHDIESMTNANKSTTCLFAYGDNKIISICFNFTVMQCEFAKTYTSVSSSIETINDILTRKVDILTIECDSLASFVNDTLSIGRQCIVRCKDSTGWGPTGVANQWYRCIAIYQNDFDTSISGNIDCSIQMWVGTSVSSSTSETVPYIGTIKGGVTTGYTLDVKKLATVAELDDLKKSVSDGKTLLAEAITGKGVETASDATFETMANNVSNIENSTLVSHNAGSAVAWDYSSEADTISVTIPVNWMTNFLHIVIVYDNNPENLTWSYSPEDSSHGQIELITKYSSGLATCFIFRGSGFNTADRVSMHIHNISDYNDYSIKRVIGTTIEIESSGQYSTIVSQTDDMSRVYVKQNRLIVLFGIYDKYYADQYEYIPHFFVYRNECSVIRYCEIESYPSKTDPAYPMYMSVLGVYNMAIDRGYANGEKILVTSAEIMQRNDSTTGAIVLEK